MAHESVKHPVIVFFWGRCVVHLICSWFTEEDTMNRWDA